MNDNKYELIYRDLAGKIAAGTFAVGDYLPSENVLRRQYDVSRETIRKALLALLNEGKIQKIHGKGSVVIGTRPALSSPELKGFTEIAASLDVPTNSRLVENDSVSVDPDRFFSKEGPVVRFGTNRAQPAILIGRLRQIRNQPVSLDRDFVLTDVVPTLPPDLAETSLYGHVERSVAPISYAEREITMVPADWDDHQFLEVQLGTSVVVIRQKVYLTDTRLAILSESRLDPQHFHYREFVRRHLSP
ncbi:UTRA domain-containing protein [Schleiferilactobacillus shenzhenensis]|uniref:HTH gntR-type domain-containing protein n=1 Tax=Schleiferilactobacillus shenzhenensis LY-73 TaxID=1231336 RepID=U4TT02_9LACO|nr:UTRA domain-containing protein [Schleiferilactobacillus shenzhenensis]ERL65013.1 hypothetical protein L248_3175 [Schleiferilactobacillus shenzhenensis LY-73]